MNSGYRFPGFLIECSDFAFSFFRAFAFSSAFARSFRVAGRHDSGGLSMKTALHTVSYAGVWPGQVVLPLERIVDKAAELGYDGVMIVAKRPHASPLDMDRDRRARLRDQIAARGLELAALAGYTDFGAGHDQPGIPIREMQVLAVTELARLARDLGGSVVRVFTAFERPGVSYDRLWADTVNTLKECAQRAAEVGVTLAVQNHHDLA